MRDRRKEVDKLLQYLKSKIDVDIVDINNSFIFRMTTDLNIITLHCQYGSNIVFQIDFFGREITIRYLNNTTRNAYYTYEEFSIIIGMTNYVKLFWCISHIPRL